MGVLDKKKYAIGLALQMDNQSKNSIYFMAYRKVVLPIFPEHLWSTWKHVQERITGQEGLADLIRGIRYYRFLFLMDKRLFFN